MTRPREIEPIFFAGDEPLFGCYHPARAGQERGHAVLLCPPAFQEYILSHRSLKRLAVQLARSGYPALRFDYRGTGDSAGDLPEARLAGWTEDVGRAARELAGRSGRRRIVLLGLRLGGSVAALASAGVEGLGGVVLWDPVARGDRHLVELVEAQRDTLRRLRQPGGENLAPGSLDEVSGFPLPPPLREDLATLDLAAARIPAGTPVLLLDTQAEPAVEALGSALKAAGASLAWRRDPGPRVWEAEVNRVLVPADQLREIASWMKETCP